MADTLAEAGMRKTLDISISMYVTLSHADLKFLMSHCSVETHTFVASWGEPTPTLEDVMVMFCLSLFVDNNYNGHYIRGGGEDTAVAECCPHCV